METLLIQADRAVLPGGVLEEDPVYVAVEGGRISGVFRGRSSAPVTDYPTMHTPLLCPGFVDTHTHGLGGAEDVVDFWLQPEHSQRLFPRYGTTSFLATVVLPRGHAKTQATLDVLNERCGKTGYGAVLEGIHAEGPVVNDLGGLPPSHQDLTLTEFQSLLDSMPSLRMMTISPHLDTSNNYLRIQALVNRSSNRSMMHVPLTCSSAKLIHWETFNEEK
ncbi:N-acetylglucosamine-6-phosphate deacetylase [Geodia barretti]|uniref:N-acetylglucosamine-6-phosphate deacetylase n=1 Tax=Geodia barretti TaxID=519541 RepID=A0AA35WTT1_GEOBA|nr:N-acetylglucosamine-6-phosphate deacetylase [Geodia barretti]